MHPLAVLAVSDKLQLLSYITSSYLFLSPPPLLIIKHSREIIGGMPKCGTLGMWEAAFYGINPQVQTGKKLSLIRCFTSTSSWEPSVGDARNGICSFLHAKQLFYHWDVTTLNTQIVLLVDWLANMFGGGGLCCLCEERSGILPPTMPIAPARAPAWTSRNHCILQHWDRASCSAIYFSLIILPLIIF